MPEDETAPIPQRHTIPALIAVALACGTGIPQALNDFRSDDWTLLNWGRAGDIWAFLTTPPPFPYYRPLNALCWQVVARTFGVEPWPGELLLLGLWGAALAFLYGIAARSVGPWGGLAAVTLAVCTREVRELVNWRSWLTTTGGLAGILGALWFAGGGRSGASIVALAFGAGFKEVAWWHGGAALAASRRYGLATLALGAMAVHMLVFAPPLPEGALSLAFVPRNAMAFAQTLLAWAWPPGLVVLALGAPRVAWRGPSVALLLAAVLAWVPPVGFYLYSPFYFIEGALLGLLALLPVAAATVRSRPRYAAVVVAIMAICLARPAQWKDFAENIPWQQRRMREGRALFLVGRGAKEVWAPVGDPGACGLAADLLVFEGAVRVDAAPPLGRELRDCLVVR